MLFPFPLADNTVALVEVWIVQPGKEHGAIFPARHNTLRKESIPSRNAAIARGKCCRRVTFQNEPVMLVAFPRLASVLCLENHQLPTYRIAEQHPAGAVQPEAVKEPLRAVRILEQQRPRLASIARLVE